MYTWSSSLPPRFLIEKEDKISLSFAAEDGEFLAEILPPGMFFRERIALPPKAIEVSEQIEECGGGLFRRITRWVNRSGFSLHVQFLLSVRTGFRPENWVIPCVSYQGNPYGSGNSPKGLTKDGEPWVFAYDRTSIPSCTLSEQKKGFVATFASDRTADSLRSSCSLQEEEDGRFCHTLHYPITERPVSYIGKNEMGAPYEEFHAFPDGAAFEVESYLFCGKPIWENYGYYSLLRRAFPLFRHEHRPCMDIETAERVCLDYLRLAVHVTDGIPQIGYFLRDYTHPIGNHQSGEWDGLTLKDIEKDPSRNKMIHRPCGMTMGFASQGMMTCRMLLREALKKDDRGLRDHVLSVLDTWVALQEKNGLLQVSYPARYPDLDVTQLGWGASELLKIHCLLKEHGIERESYYRTVRRLCEFFLTHGDEEILLGKSWSYEGECLSWGGCGGSFLIKAMLELSAYEGETVLLNRARQMFDLYFQKYLSRFLCCAGAIDCESIDKESSFPFVYAALELYRRTGEEKYLAHAQQAATYFLSWMFFYDGIYPADSDFARIGYHTSGGTAVSVEHQCLDPYAAVLIPDLFDLSETDGDPFWREAGKLIWCNCLLGMAGPGGWDFHGMHRPAGAQNECFAQARWTKYRSTPEFRGHMNDFIGIWLNCFKLYAMERLGNDLEK